MFAAKKNTNKKRPQPVSTMGLERAETVQLAGPYDSEIAQYNKGKEKSKQIRDPEKPIYVALRKDGFAKGDIKMPSSGADFVAWDSGDKKLAIVEVKGGNSGNWLKDDNLNFESGNHVPAKQIKMALDNNKGHVKTLLAEKTSSLFSDKQLQVAVTNLGDDDAMMALILDSENNIKAQHPLTVSEATSFVSQYSESSITEGVVDLPETYFEWLMEKGIYEDTQLQDAYGDALENDVQSWFYKDQDAKLSNLDMLEAFYNVARQGNAHEISKSNLGANNPDTLNSLNDLAESINGDKPLHIRFVPVASRFPA